MKILLARIDDRFIHGQVTVGWSQKLRPDRIILANNEVASDPWQSRVYRSSVPPEIKVTILGTSQTAAQLTSRTGPFDPDETCIMLAGTPLDMHFIHRHGLFLTDINLGGMHHGPGKREMLPFLYVDREDLTLFRSFLNGGTRLFGQQVPGSKETVIDLPLIEAMEGQF